MTTATNLPSSGATNAAPVSQANPSPFVGLKYGDLILLNPSAKWPRWHVDAVLCGGGYITVRNVATGREHSDTIEGFARRFPKAVLQS